MVSILTTMISNFVVTTSVNTSDSTPDYMKYVIALLVVAIILIILFVKSRKNKNK